MGILLDSDRSLHSTGIAARAAVTATAAQATARKQNVWQNRNGYYHRRFHAEKCYLHALPDERVSSVGGSRLGTLPAKVVVWNCVSDPTLCCGYSAPA